MEMSEAGGDLTRAAVRTALATAAYGVLHSALASRQAKDAAARVFGERHRNGLYRAAYNVQSIATLGLLIAYLLRQPDRVLYRLNGPATVAARAGQAAALAYAVAAAWEVGVLRVTGIASATAWARWVVGSLVGSSGNAAPAPVPAEPEAQGPAPDAAGGDGPLRIGGPFRLSRHPLNLVPVPIFWLAPTMTVKRAVFSAVATAYLVLGSWHEEARLRRAHGDEYARYQRSGIPFYLPTRFSSTGKRVSAERAQLSDRH
jgi:protein-S-isoprenylcysteine O-methyltransferase Ste14